MKQISYERKLKFLQEYMNEYVDKWPVAIPPFSNWLETALRERVMAGQERHAQKKKSICHYCKRPFEETGVEKTNDHIIPLSKGGLNRKENRVPCCFLCNQWKADRSLEDWLKEVKRMIKRQEDTLDYPYHTLGQLMNKIKQTIEYCKQNYKKISTYKV